MLGKNRQMSQFLKDIIGWSMISPDVSTTLGQNNNKSSVVERMVVVQVALVPVVAIVMVMVMAVEVLVVVVVY